MKEPGFERTFRDWCRSAEVDWHTYSYPRPFAGGEVRGHRLRPPGEVRAGMLVVHGAGNDALFGFAGVFAALLEAGIEVFTFDLDGHGQGGTTVLGSDSIRDSVPAALEAWGGPHGGAPVHGMGVSLGASLLLHALPGLGTALAGATLLSTPLRVHLTRRSLLAELGPTLVRTGWRERRWFGITGLIPSFGPFGRGRYPLRLATPPQPGPFGYVPVINDLLEDLQLLEAARSTHVPVRVIHGEEDRLVPVEHARQIAAALPARELTVLPRHGHLTAWLAPETLRLLLASTGGRAVDHSSS